MEEIVTPGISFMMGSGDRFSPTTIAMDATKICQLFNDFSKDVLASSMISTISSPTSTLASLILWRIARCLTP
jgi:hypothetical protein